MPILFSAVAQNKDTVASHGCCDGNFMEIVQQILSKISSKNDKMTYSHGYYLLHYIMENQKFFFCITDKKCQRSKAFLFLNEIKCRFRTKRGQFSCILAEEMARYNDDCSTITIRKGELDELNKIGVASSESILGEKRLLVKNPDTLEFSTISYVGGNPQQIQSAKGKSILYLVFLAVIIFVLWLVVTKYGQTSLVFIVCIFMFCLKQFTIDNKS